MKKYCFVVGMCLASQVVFCQTRDTVVNKAAVQDGKSIEMTASADTSLVGSGKKIVADDKKKRPKRDNSHKECSRMKS